MMAVDPGLHFLRPWAWLLLLPLPWVLWSCARNVHGRAAFARIADAALLPHLLQDSGARRGLALALVASAWLLATAALAGPAWQRIEAPLYVNGGARVVVLSLSNDMRAADLKPDRMTRARFAVRDLLDAAGDARMALVAYAGAAFTVAPLTNDKRTVFNLLSALGPDVMPVPGNDAAAGIAQAVALLRQSHVEGGELVLVTDTADAAAMAAAGKARAQGLRVDVLGIGSTAGAPVPASGGGFVRDGDALVMARRDDAALRAVAAAGGGRYVVLQADGSGAAAFAAPVKAAAQASRERAGIWRDGGIWLLPVLVVFAALAFRRGWLLVFVVCLLPATIPPARAADANAWFANRDQRALQALRQGDATQARQLAHSLAMRGAADYRGGDYAAAAHAFAQGAGASAHYNLGNALAKQGRYREAIAAYQRALQEDPGMTDARANLAAVEDWLRKQSPQQRGTRKQAAPGSAAASSKPQSPSASASASSSSADAQGQQPASAPAGAQRDGTVPAGQAPGPSAAGQGSDRPSPGQDAAKTRDDHAMAADAAKQQQQAGQAGKALARALQGAQASMPAKASSSPRAFALGQAEPRDDKQLDAQQRAMLRAVPDDPGALLRRKFQLEWAQRQGQSQQGGPP